LLAQPWLSAKGMTSQDSRPFIGRFLGQRRKNLYAPASIANNDKHTDFATLKAVHDRQLHFNGIGLR
jgi:hypothetical protein